MKSNSIPGAEDGDAVLPAWYNVPTVKAMGIGIGKPLTNVGGGISP